MVDIEADGPVPGLYSMVELGAVIVEHSLTKTFHGKLKPISDNYKVDALSSFNRTRDDTLKFDDPLYVMTEFEKWINKNSNGRHMFISDNNGFDWMFTCYYFHKFLNNNPFGYSSTNLGSLYKGMVINTFKNFKKLRKTAHTHNPVDDAVGNAEALLYMYDNMNLNIDLR